MSRKNKAPRVLIVVQGGLVQSVVSDGTVQVLVKDFDNIKEGDKFDPDGFRKPDLVCATKKAFAAEVIADISDDQLVNSGVQ